jgi:asparagine synthase (glutamine-hydrolysing)
MARRWPHQLVRDDLTQELKLLERYREQAAFDAPFRRINDFVLRNRLGSNISSRLETCTLFAATYGIDYRWPLLDARLLQQWLSTPSIEKSDPVFGRYLHRRAIDGVVASKVAWKPDKYMGRHITIHGGRRGVDASMLESARARRADLHPILLDVVNPERLDAQLAAAATGRLDGNAQIQFSWNVLHLRALNMWLWRG